jgi:acetoin utilization deacetylase AcuC-like enzyme
VSIALVTDERFIDHEPGRHHPERPQRLHAVLRGLEPWVDAVVPLAPTLVDDATVLAVHDKAVLHRVVETAAAGGGRIDADTVMSPGSLVASRLAAGAGLVAVDALRRGQADTAFCAVRPPGHHATRSVSMGFCLLNNIAITARHLAALGERVAIVDIDAHHGNGTQDVFFDDPRVLFISTHQYPWYPGSGALDERGIGAGLGSTLNVPLPAGAAGDVYRRAVDEVIVPAIERFRPDWVLVSAGFDAHRADPLTDLGLSAGDYHALVQRIVAVSPVRRVVAFLEGGYDLEALTASTTAVVGALLGEAPALEASTSAGPGAEVVAAAAAMVAAVPTGA